MKTIATVMMAMLGLVCAQAQAQGVYRCGNTYSATPCPGGTAVEAADTPTAAQAKRGEAAARRDAKLAGDMEKERLAQEKAVAGPSKLVVGAAKAPASAASAVKAKGKGKDKKGEPEMVTATGPKPAASKAMK
jgi:hypothetical protein